jgi:hypothetical protein
MMIEGIAASGGEYASLAHTTTQHLANPMGFGKQLARTHQD